MVVGWGELVFNVVELEEGLETGEAFAVGDLEGRLESRIT